MNKNTFTTVKLQKGEVSVYNFGKIKLHAYKTEALISDEVFILEKDGRAVVIESPCFFDNEEALTAYVNGLNANIDGILIAYHDAGGQFLPNVKKYATAKAKVYGEEGGGKALIDGFQKAFGSAFDASLHKITDVLSAGKNVIGGIEFIVNENSEAYTIEIPEINAVYTHMLGHDCHSIVAGAGHADAIIAELDGYIKRGFTLILTSHYTPEDLKDAQTKIDYINDLKKLAANSGSAEEFKAAVNAKYPEYDGANYLDITAGAFFAK